MFPSIDESVCLTAAGDAILELAEHPQKYKPHMRRMAPWLLMKARDDVKNLRRSELRRRSVGPRKQFKVVEFSALAGDDRWHEREQGFDPADDPPVTRSLLELADEADSPESAFDPETERTAKEQAILDQAMQEVSRELDPLEHRVLQMMFGPSRASVEQIASAVGAGHLSLDERRRAAKQVTERITKRIKRVAARLQSEAS